MYLGNYRESLPSTLQLPFAQLPFPIGTRPGAATFDGSTTGMIEVEGLDHIYYEAELPFAPLPGSTLPTARETARAG
jgi:hypothetical protein